MLLSYFDNGKCGTAVLFIHGTASASDVWEKQYKLLSKSDYRVIGVDLRGHGKSIDPGGICTIDDHINDLSETLDYINIKEPITIVGHSFGAVLALKFAERYPSKVYKLLLVSLPAKVPRLLLRYYKWFLGKPIELIKKKLNLVLKLPLKKKHKLAVKSSMNVVKQIWKESYEWNFLNSVPQVKCPVYLSVGRFDYIALNSMIKKVHKMLPDSSYTVFNWASHTCMLDQPHAFNKWILTVLALPVIQKSIGI